MGETVFLYHVPSATHLHIQIFKRNTISGFMHKNIVYNSYLHDQMVVPKIYGPIFIYLGFMSYHEIHKIWYVQGNGLNSHFLMLLKEICTFT